METINNINFDDYNKVLYIVFPHKPSLSMRNVLSNKAKNNFIIIEKVFIVTDKNVVDSVELDNFLYSYGELHYPDGELTIASDKV